MGFKFKLIVSFIIPSLLFIFISIPLVLNKVPRNCFYGFRTKKTLASDEIWYKANRWAGLSFLVAALITLMGCAFLFCDKDKLSFDALNSIGFGFFIVPIIVALFSSFFYLRRL